MKYHFKNIGLIKNATLELGGLTILAGPNNTGKTYIAYTLYGFFQTGHRYFTMEEDAIQTIVQELTESGHAEFNLRNLDFNKLFSGMTKQYSSNLHEVFSARKEEFQHAEFFIETIDPLSVFSNDKNVISLTYNERLKLFIMVSVFEENINLIFDLSNNETVNLWEHGFIYYAIFNWLHSVFFLTPYICVSERLGIPLFYRDLDIQKIEFVEQLQRLTDNKKTRDPIAIFLEMERKINTRYALPVKENIDFVRSIPNIINKDSLPEIAALNNYIISMTGGVYRNQPPEGLVFSSKPYSKANKFSLTSNLWSSSVKSLSNLFFYFKHIAKPGQLLIIDEPEIHLTPQNQIILARMLAACVNQGIKVLITTHSDYLIKEFNNLIMFHNLSEAGRSAFMGRKNSPYKIDEMLNPAQVKAYVCQKGGVVSCRMDRYGMEVASMDAAIEEMNRTANDLMGLMDGEEI